MDKFLVLVLVTILLSCEQTRGYAVDWRRHICPERAEMIMRVKACTKVLNSSKRVDMITKCYSLKGARDCLAEVYAGCTAYDLLMLDLPDNIRYAEREVTKEISKCEIF